MDTSAFKAFYDDRDSLHKKARAFMDEAASKRIQVRAFYTSDYVLDETITIIRFAHSHAKAVEFARAVTSSKATRLLYVERNTFQRSLDLFLDSKDKEWSFTDCVSFTMMKDLGLTTAFTFDPHFKQAGFHLVP